MELLSYDGQGQRSTTGTKRIREKLQELVVPYVQSVHLARSQPSFSMARSMATMTTISYPDERNIHLQYIQGYYCSKDGDIRILWRLRSGTGCHDG